MSQINAFIAEFDKNAINTAKLALKMGVEGWEAKKCEGKIPTRFTKLSEVINILNAGDIIAGKITTMKTGTTLYFGRGAVKKIWLNPKTRERSAIWRFSKGKDNFLNGSTYKDECEIYVWRGNEVEMVSLAGFNF